MNKRPIYLDNNGTTLMSPQAIKEFNTYISCFNPSTNSKFAKPAKKAIEDATDYILMHCGVSSLTHTVLFTSCGTESNCFILRSCVKAYHAKMKEKGRGGKPHVVTSQIEHNSILKCLQDMTLYGEVDVTYVKPNIYGLLVPRDVGNAITANTCLISIMFANNELPGINDVIEISKIAEAKKIPFHTDAVQIFGKSSIDVAKYNITALSASAHKFNGPKGVGILVLNNKLIDGYKLTAEINGTQQHGLRGGTENVAGIASTHIALKTAFVDRKEKNKKLINMRDMLLSKLSNHFVFNDFVQICNGKFKNNLELCRLGPDTKNVLPHVALIAVCKHKGRPFCNTILKEDLDKQNIIVSIGSACSTSDPHASHVMNAINAPVVIKKGVIRISFGDMNSLADVERFVPIFIECVNKQCKDLTDIKK